MEDLGQKTARSMVWSALERGSTNATNFVIGIVLARILPPEDFGLVAMLTIFILLSNILIDSGFGMALIRKRDKSEVDFSSVFFFNIVVGVVCYLIMYVASPLIAGFYKIPELSRLLRYLSVTLIFSSFTVVQNAILRERMNFRLIALINFAAMIVSGAVSIWTAYSGAGVWALVLKSVVCSVLASVLVWVFVKWRPRFVFSFAVIREMFGFGSKLLISGFAQAIAGNLSSLLIGRFFNVRQLGYYSRGTQFSDIIATMFQSVMISVAFPAFSHMTNEYGRFKSAARRMVNSGSLVICAIMILFAAVARPFVLLFLTEKWLAIVPVIRLLCISRAITSIGFINISILVGAGRSDLSLRLDIFKITINILTIVVGVRWGIMGVAIGQVVWAIVCFYADTWYMRKLFDYGPFQQLADLRLMFVALAAMTMVVVCVVCLLNSEVLQFLLGIIVGLGIYVAVLWYGRSPGFREMVLMTKKWLNDNAKRY